MIEFHLPPGSPLVMSLERVADSLSMSTATVQKLVRENAFPKPRLLSPNRVGWVTAEVLEWVSERPHSNLLPPPNTGAPKRRQPQPAQA